MPEKSFTIGEARTIGKAIAIDWSTAPYDSIDWEVNRPVAAVVHTHLPILVTMRVGAVMHRGVRCR